MHRRPPLGLERRGEAAAAKVGHQAHHAPEFVVGHLAADVAGDLQHQLHLVGAEAVVTAEFEDEAPARLIAKGIGSCRGLCAQTAEMLWPDDETAFSAV